ncbi:hypothetical protein BDW72DRAFT_213704 [Aspergillus terricola var. indicus]
MGFFSAWALCLSLLPFSLAQVRNRALYIASQADADNVGRDCPIVNSDVFINDSYTGSLVLNGVRNITWGLRLDLVNSTNSQLTSIELPDLEYFSAPKLKTVNYMSLRQLAPGSELSICSIDGCKEIGPYSPIASAVNLTLPSLTSAGKLTLAAKTERSALRLLGRG